MCTYKYMQVVLGPLSEYHFSNHTYTSKHRNKQNLLNTLRPNVVENKHSREEKQLLSSGEREEGEKQLLSSGEREEGEKQLLSSSFSPYRGASG